MADDSEHVEVPAESARSGETPHIARYVLMISVMLVVASFAVLLIIWG